MQNAYVVIVNNKYMMRVQAESAYDAEHAVLDRFADEINKYHVITCVKAFEQYKIKTSWLFRDYFLRCDFINMRLLEELVKEAPIERFVFGTDQTFNDPRIMVGRVLCSDLDDGVKRLILSENFERAIGRRLIP